MGVFLSTIDGSIVNVALPTLVKTLRTNFATVQWVVLAYLLSLATLMLSIGRLADIVGKKPIYLAGFVVFTLGSALCGLAGTVHWLIAFRVLQAIGGVMMLALGTGILTEAFPPTERGKALGMIGAIVSTGIILGPTVGGIIIDVLSWHWIFFVNIPVGIIGTLMVQKVVPNFKAKPGQRFDFLGAALLFICLLSLLLAFTFGQRLGFRQPVILILFGIWALGFVLFLLTEFRSPHPMIDLRLFRDRLFSLNLFTGFITFVATAGIVLLMPFYLQNVLGYAPRQIGLLLAVVPVAAGIFSPFSGRLSDRVGPRKITVLGLFFQVIGFISLTTLNEHVTALGYCLRFLPIGIGIGVFQSPNNSAIMGVAPREKLGVVSSLLSITRTLGQTSGIAALGAFWAYRVAVYSGYDPGRDATQAAIQVQVKALHDAVYLIVALLILAFSLSVWALVQELNMRRALASEDVH